MADEKDRLGDILRDKQRADEGRYFAERDRAALAKLRAAQTADNEEALRALARMRCPKDGTPLASTKEFGVAVDACPSCNGMWLDPGELEQIANREKDSWIGRYFFRPKG